MKIKKFILIFLLLFTPLRSVYSLSEKADFATFSLVAYDDWGQPSKPLPEGWSYLTKVSPNLQTGGYFGAAFIHCVNQYVCEVAIAHRGTTFSIFDYFQDFLIYLQKTPTYYKNASGFVEDIREYLKTQPYVVPLISNTGHSLGGLLAELIQASNDIAVTSIVFKSMIFDGPGSKTIIKNMMDEKILPINAFENVYYSTQIFSGINAINTCNPQVDTIYPSVIMFDHEDFSNVSLNTMGEPGKLYYFKDYTLHQHKMINFYNFYHEEDLKDKYHSLVDWPVGFNAGYKSYLNHRINEYGNSYYWYAFTDYVWNHNQYYREIYKNDFFKFQADFYSQLDKDRESNIIVTNKNLSILDDEILGSNRSVYTKTNRQTLHDAINGNLTGHRDILRKTYAESSIDKKLYYAVLCDDAEFSEKLITQAHANPNALFGSKKYPLIQIAEILGYLDMVKLLLKYHADPNLKNMDGDTALHIVAHERYEDAPLYAKVLLENHANPKLTNNAGQTPLTVMQSHCKNCMVSFLKVLI